MKKILIKTMMAVMVAMIPLALPAVNTITYTASYGNTIIGTDTLGGVTYKTVHYGDLYNGGAPGTPSLPVEYIRFSVPYNATNFTVTAQPMNTLSFFMNYAIYPCQVPRMMNDTTPVVITLPDSTAYYSGSEYPTQRAWIVDEGFLAGENHIVTVAVMPNSYKYSATGLYRHTLNESKTVNLTLSYDLNGTPSMYPIAGTNESSRVLGRQLTQSIVVNPDSVPGFAPPIATNQIYAPYQAPSITASLPQYPYLIITTPDLSHSLRRLVALKRQKGYNVKMVTVNEILNDPYAQYGDVVNVNGEHTVTFDDNPGIIRQYLKLSKWFFGTQYLLLVGSNVPYRIQRKGTILGTYDVPTDLYYSDLNGNWSSNTTIDLFPDLFVGRLLAKNENQVLNYTDKLFRYELNPGHGDYTYLRRALYTEGLGFFDYSRGIGQYMNLICPDSMIIRERTLEHDPTGRDVIDSINSNKFGFWGIFNHGCPSCIMTYGVNVWNKLYSDSFYCLHAIDSVKVLPFSGLDTETRNGLNNIENYGFEMITYSTACLDMPFDVITEYADLPMNFGESFTTGRNYGGPSYLGNTRDGVNPTSKNLAKLFAKYLTEYTYKIGIAEALSKCEEYDDAFDDYLAMTHNLLGDPEFEMWTDSPQHYSNIVVTRTNDSITVNGIDSDSTIVAYYSNDGSIGTDTVSISRVVLSAISPNSTVMLYKHNHIPYIAPLELQNITFSNDQYVIANDVIAGESVDSNRTPGDVIVKCGIEYEIEASGTVTLHDGFNVEKGATFAVYPSSF